MEMEADGTDIFRDWRVPCPIKKQIKCVRPLFTVLYVLNTSLYAKHSSNTSWRATKASAVHLPTSVA